MTKEKMDEMRRFIDGMREACRQAAEEARRKGEGVQVGGRYVYLSSPSSHSPIFQKHIS